MDRDVPSKRKNLMTKVMAVVLILVTAAGCIFYGKTSYEDMVSKVDERLSVRLEKIDMYQKGFSASLINDEDTLLTSQVISVVYSYEPERPYAIEFDFEPYHINYLCYARVDETGIECIVADMEQSNWFDPEGMPEEYKMALIWKDEDENLYISVSGRTMLIPAEYAYTIVHETESMYYVTGMNMKSNEEEMVSLAHELLSQKQKNGWEGNYRYLVADLENSQGGTDPYLLLTDASEEKSTWRNTIMMVSGCAALLDVVLIVLVFLLEQRKNKQLISGTEPKTSKGSSETESSGRSLSSAGIPKDIAKQILSYVDDTERSTGPNGYLDSIRNTVEENIRKE